MPSPAYPTKNRDVVRVLWQHSWKYKGQLLVLVVAVTGAVSANVFIPLFLKQFLDALVTTTPGSAGFAVVTAPLFAMVMLQVLHMTLWRVFGFTMNRFEPRVMADLQETGFRHVLEHSYEFFSNAFAGSLVRKIARVGRAFEGIADELLIRFIPVTVTLVGAVCGLATRSPGLALGFAVWAVLFVVGNYWAARWKMPLDIEKAEADSAVTATMADALANSITIKLFTGGTSERNRLQSAITHWRRLTMRSWFRQEIIFTFQNGLMVVASAALLYAGAYLWSRGVLTAGDLALIETYLLLSFNQLWDIGRSFRRVAEGIADAKEMVEIIQLPPGVRDRRGAKPLIVGTASVSFADVSFHYHATRPVLERFSLQIAPGEKIALVGPSGAGKSTITKLLFRFYDVDRGTILVDGQDIAKVTQESLRANIALVPQEPILFHRTLMDNIRYGRPHATDAEVEQAARLARCHDFITELPDGYGTFVGERGVKLSGGERQRVAIARAILKNAPILVLDEATSSLDSESEQLIQEALKEVMRGKTTIVVAHRLSTIMQMDRIVVMEGGRVATVGTHQELLAQTGTYRTLWNIQAGGFAEA